MILEPIVTNLNKNIPECPTITYEIVGDFGEDGTKTIYECSAYAEVQAIINAIKNNNLDIPHMDLYEDELKNLETIGINIVLSTTQFDIVTCGSKKRISSLLTSYKVKNDDVARKVYNKLTANEMAEYTCTAISSLQSIDENLDLTNVHDIARVKQFVLEIIVNEIRAGFRDKTTGELL